jgi:hypothetical protein
MSKDIWIQGDIVGTGAANRSVDFDIYKTTDLYISGETYGYGLTPTYTGAQFSAGTPWFNGYAVSVTAGSVTTVGKASSVSAQNIALNVPNQVLGGYQIDVKGEPISVQQAVFKFNYGTAAASSNLLTNVALYDENGAVVAGPVDAVAVSGTEQSVTFTDTITYKIGSHVYTLKGKLPSTVPNGETLSASTTPSGWSNVTGQTTGNTITLSNGVFAMNTMTVKAAALTVSVAGTPAALTKVLLVHPAIISLLCLKTSLQNFCQKSKFHPTAELIRLLDLIQLNNPTIQLALTIMNILLKMLGKDYSLAILS